MIDLAKRKNVQIGLSEQDYVAAANLLKCEVVAIKAVSLIESGNSGYFPSGRPKILFEGHFFYRFASQYGKATIIAKEYPNICYPKWTKAHYFGGEREYDRLKAALDACRKHGIPESLAFRSASWGKYQIMGDNFQKAGFDTVYSFVEAMFLSERNHLKSFCSYIINSFLDDELRELNFTKFALGYNGLGYKRNQYDTKMQSAYKKFKQSELPLKHEEAPLVDNVEIVEIPSVTDADPADNPEVVNSSPQLGNHANEESVKINAFETVIEKFKHAKEIVITALGAIGLSGTSIAALYEKITANPLIEYAILGLAIISILIAGILVVVYFIKHLDFHHKLDLINKENERYINIEQLRIRANPQLYNVEIERNVAKESF